MRLGGAFPLQISDVSTGGPAIQLSPGETFYPPPGNYLVWLGLVTGLQVWDPLQQQWRTAGQPTIEAQAFDTDGYNWRLVNLSGVVTGANITNAGSGATNGIGAVATGVTITLSAPAAPGVTATAQPIVGGAVVAPTVSQAGTGFLVPPLIIIDPPPQGGIQATAICTLTAIGGGISSVTMVNAGAGYTATNPQFYILPQTAQYQGGPASSLAAGAINVAGIVNTLSALPGWGVATGQSVSGSTGALLNPATLTGSGTLTGINITSYGTNYTGTTIPAITITGCGAAAATALMSLSMTGISGLVGGAGYTGGTPIWETSLGLVSQSANNLVYLPRAARGVTTVSAGAVLTMPIEDPGFGFQKVPQIAVINVGSIASGQATATAVVGGINDVSLLQTRVGS